MGWEDPACCCQKHARTRKKIADWRARVSYVESQSQINDTGPKELERICLKCLSKRMTDRYSSLTSPKTWSASNKTCSKVEKARGRGGGRRLSRARKVMNFELDRKDFVLLKSPTPDHS